jgi:hypothetical protein
MEKTQKKGVSEGVFSTKPRVRRSKNDLTTHVSEGVSY